MQPPLRYFDHAASAPLRRSARDAMFELGPLANPASTHRAGQRAADLLEQSRERIAAVMDAHPTEVIFTSGGTESVNLGVKGLWQSRGSAGRIVTAAIEHHATLDSLESLEDRGAEIIWIGCSRDSVTDAASFAQQLSGAAVATMSWANNETGVLQPVREVSEAAALAGVPLHIDAVAALGHVPVSFRSAGAACVSIAAHKVGGPVGVGALLVARDADVAPQIHGGGQQRGIRSGTADVAGAVGFAIALEEATRELHEEHVRLSALAEQLHSAVRVPGVRVTGYEEPKLPGTIHLTVEGASAEALTFLLDAEGFQASNGSACTAGVVQESHVVRAMGLRDAPLRISMGWTTTQDDVDALAGVLPRVIERARSSR